MELECTTPQTITQPFVYCGEAEPTSECECRGYCDYHLGATPTGMDPAILQAEATQLQHIACTIDRAFV